MTYAVDVCTATTAAFPQVPEVDDEDDVVEDVQRPTQSTLNQLLAQFDLMALLVSPRKAAPDPLVQTKVRFSFIENRYGTRSTQPRRTTKQTLNRLANPIHGFTSTLNALPPEVRKKRQQTDALPPLLPVKLPPIRHKPPRPKDFFDRLSKPIHVRDKIQRPTKTNAKPVKKKPAAASNQAKRPPLNKPTKKSTASSNGGGGGGFFLTQMDHIKPKKKPPRKPLKSNKVVPQRRDDRRKAAANV
ncbi:unnamed protein product [Aphanomyces euteiches]|uniref:Uncharacterized protein n=1 Tax=Aphanomyces euteiches TaxID=100861 RepID=A0A6G0X056_9STRA|nr:hypothetical protein Ae201684_009811 [Aphanomyces euteiches]KAH9095978.1 hypothetical protein Ae201684P_010184 [Aphanomyces euteiches]KAH9154627.1 hypothetical protein AeRB84_003296 [Aphanomyces euteiches]